MKLWVIQKLWHLTSLHEKDLWAWVTWASTKPILLVQTQFYLSKQELQWPDAPDQIFKLSLSYQQRKKLWNSTYRDQEGQSQLWLNFSQQKNLVTKPGLKHMTSEGQALPTQLCMWFCHSKDTFTVTVNKITNKLIH